MALDIEAELQELMHQLDKSELERVITQDQANHIFNLIDTVEDEVLVTDWIMSQPNLKAALAVIVAQLVDEIESTPHSHPVWTNLIASFSKIIVSCVLASQRDIGP